MYGEGISKVGEILDMAVQYDIVHKGGSWFSYGDRRLGQGRDNVKEIIKMNLNLLLNLSRRLRIKLLRISKSKGRTCSKG